MTGDLVKRIWQHRQGGFSEFTSKYSLKMLVYFEEFDRPMEAIEVEKKIKGWKRQKKLELIEMNNPGWNDLAVLDPSLRSG